MRGMAAALARWLDNVVCIHVMLAALAWFWAHGRVEEFLHGEDAGDE